MARRMWTDSSFRICSIVSVFNASTTCVSTASSSEPLGIANSFSIRAWNLRWSMMGIRKALPSTNSIVRFFFSSSLAAVRRAIFHRGRCVYTCAGAEQANTSRVRLAGCGAPSTTACLSNKRWRRSARMDDHCVYFLRLITVLFMKANSRAFIITKSTSFQSTLLSLMLPMMLSIAAAMSSKNTFSRCPFC